MALVQLSEPVPLPDPTLARLRRACPSPPHFENTAGEGQLRMPE
jgi:hypothetical protein